MKTYAKFALPLALICGVLTVAINAALILAITINMFMPAAVLPLHYYEFLHFPLLSVFLPFAAVLALAPIALEFGFYETVELPTYHLVEHDAPSSLPVSAVTNAVANMEPPMLKAA